MKLLKKAPTLMLVAFAFHHLGNSLGGLALREENNFRQLDNRLTEPMPLMMETRMLLPLRDTTCSEDTPVVCPG